MLPIIRRGRFASTAGFAVSLEGTGSRITGVIHCDQPRALDILARGGTRAEAVPEPLLADLLARLAAIFA